MQRVLPGLLLVAFWLLLLLYGSATQFWLVMTATAAIAAHEYLAMLFPAPLADWHRAGLLLVLIQPVFLLYPGAPAFFYPGVFFTCFFLLCCYCIVFFNDATRDFANLTRLVFGLVFVGFLMAHLVLIRYLPEGNAWLLVLTAITAGSDTGAYYAGRIFGQHKLCPAVSPKKTIEGAIGGMVTAVMLAIIFAKALSLSGSLPLLLAMAMVLTGVGIVGDLAESVIKRGVGVKDSGTILGGHGGVLDRLDSLLFAAPCMYYILVISLIP